ncbi:MAG: hypothetical protein KIT19_11650 [Phycisphaeraceae bacterium]|nr:hypothetical protein [Phycisphaeraceae bacterium]
MTRSQPSIGIDIGSRASKCVAVDPHDGTIIARVIVPRIATSDSIDRDAIVRMTSILRRRNVWTGRVVLGAPPAIATSSTLELPPRSSGAPIDRLVEVELARLMRCEIGSIEAVSWEIPVGGKATHSCAMMAVACQKEKAVAIADWFDECGFPIEAIEPACIAITRIATREQTASAFVTVDLGATSGRVCVVSGGIVMLERELGELGMADRLGCAAAPLGVTPEALWARVRACESVPRPITRIAGEQARQFISRLASDVVEAVKESIGYVRMKGGTAKPQSIVLVGWGSDTAGLAPEIQAEIELPVTVAGTAAGGGAMALAYGLSLRATEEATQ